MLKPTIKLFFIIITAFVVFPIGASASWDLLGTALNNSQAQQLDNPTIAVSSSNTTTASQPYVAFQEAVGGISNVYVKQWNGMNWESMAGSLNDNVSNHAYKPDIVLDPNTDIPYVGFYEDRAGFFQATVSKWNGTGWQNAGSFNKVTTNATLAVKIAFNHQAPARGFITWIENDGSANRLWAKRFNGSDFTGYDMDCTPNGYLNSTTASSAYNPAIDIGPDNEPVIAWQEGGTMADVFVRKWNGSDWEMLGTRVGNLSTSDRYPSVAINSNDRSFIAYREGGASVTIQVKYWTGSTWNTHGSVVDTDSNLGEPVITIGDSDVPFVVYTKGTTDNVFVKFYNGTDWQSLGGSLNEVQTEDADNGDIALSEMGSYVTWREHNVGESVYHGYVKRWDAPATATPTVTPTPTIPSQMTATPTMVNTPEPDQIVDEDATKAYPLPAASQVNFAYRLTDAEGDPVVRVYNTHFRIVAEIPGSATAIGEGTVNWDCSAIAPGIYFYQITIGEKKTAMEKFIIAR